MDPMWIGFLVSLLIAALAVVADMLWDAFWEALLGLSVLYVVVVLLVGLLR